MDWIGLDVMGEGWDGRRILDGCTGDESGNGWEMCGRILDGDVLGGGCVC